MEYEWCATAAHSYYRQRTEDSRFGIAQRCLFSERPEWGTKASGKNHKTLAHHRFYFACNNRC